MYGTNVGMLQRPLENNSCLLFSAKRPKSILKPHDIGVLFPITYFKKQFKPCFIILLKLKRGKLETFHQKGKQKCERVSDFKHPNLKKVLTPQF